MIRCEDKHCPYFEEVTVKVGNKDVEKDAVRGFHPEGYCQYLQAFCDTRVQGDSCHD